MIGSAVRKLFWRTVLGFTGGVDVLGRAPDRACVIVANHSSHVDTAALLAAVPARRRPVVVAAADYWFGSRRRAVFCRLLTAGIPVRRSGGGSADLRLAASLIAAGHTVIIFPEGSRSRDGELARFRGGAARLADLADVPIVPVTLVGTSDVLPVHGHPHRAHITVRFGTPVDDLEHARTHIARTLAA